MTDKNYIANFGSAEDVNAVIEQNINGGNMILMFTDKFKCCPQQNIEDTAHLLEARVFTENAEIKLMRPTIADKFTWRLIDDTKLSPDDYMIEEQYLDINGKIKAEETESNSFEYTAIGGGKYTLPLENAEKLRIHNYISYDEQGIAQITDFRAVKYLGKGEDK